MGKSWERSLLWMFRDVKKWLSEKPFDMGKDLTREGIGYKGVLVLAYAALPPALVSAWVHLLVHTESHKVILSESKDRSVVARERNGNMKIMLCRGKTYSEANS